MVNKNRQNNMNIQRLKGANTNKQKGLLTFVKNSVKKTDVIHNELIDELIKNNYYHHIYNKFMLNDDINLEDEDFFDELDNTELKEYEILAYFDFCSPDELKDKYRGFNIIQYPLLKKCM